MDIHPGIGLVHRDSDGLDHEIEDLVSLRLFLERMRETAPGSLKHYRDDKTGGSGGWFHSSPITRRKHAGDFSKASTATCLSFVHAARLEDMADDQYQTLLNSIVADGDWTSAGMVDENAFTIAFLLEAINYLGEERLDYRQKRIVDKKVRALTKYFKHKDQASNGGVGIDASADPNAYFTFKAVRTLQSWDGLRDKSLVEDIRKWSWKYLNEESVLISSNAPDADVFELAYSVLCITTITKLEEMTAEEIEILEYALNQFFDSQLDSGRWPRGRPLFNNKKLGGDAYCYDYEVLVALLSDSQLQDLVRQHLGQLGRAAWALTRSRIPLQNGEGAYGWTSGHQRKTKSPESWATASVFHYCFKLERLVADKLRENMFRYVGEEPPLQTKRSPKAKLNSKLQDSKFQTDDGKERSLIDVIEHQFLTGLWENVDTLDHGNPFPKNVYLSMIVFGPPGTSKTKLAEYIAQALGWPYLKIDPSHLTRQGLDRLHAETYRLFGMLQSIERTVVLLDEFDELVREREGPNEVLSRFLTTAMLPKLQSLGERRRLVVLVATNHIESFDIAISRRGRFDMIVPVLTPDLKSKLKPLDGLKKRIRTIGINFRNRAWEPLGEQIADLTFHEFEGITGRLLAAPTQHEFASIVDEAHKTCTLMQVDSSGQSWKDRLIAQRSKIRLRPD